LQDGDGAIGFGDTLLNYRWQAIMEGPRRPAFSPRVSAVLPTGSVSRGLGDGSFGLQFNLPFSKQHGDVYWHWNAGVTWLPGADLDLSEPAGGQTPGVDSDTSLVSPFLAGSAIYRLRPMFNLMLESVLAFDEFTTGAGTERDTFFTLAPGARGGWNLGDHQLILGFAVPVTWGGGESEAGAFVYLSYELPFKR
jgi:hypothetical protein